MNAEERRNWLAGLKPGDRVAVSRSYEVDRPYDFVRVEYITPKRTRFDVVYDEGRGAKFDKNGDYRVGGRWGSTHAIVPITDELLARNKHIARVVRAQNRIYKAHTMRESLGELSDDELDEIAKALEFTTRK